MTLSDRNLFFKAGIALASVCTVLVIIASVVIIPVYPAMRAEVSRRPAGIFHAIISPLFSINLYAVHLSLAAMVLFALVSLIMIYHYFEQTQAQEILFVAFFSISFSLETARLIIPLQMVYDIPPLYLIMASRILLFGRYFGIFSLFTASVCAAGLDIQKQRNIIFIIIVATLIIALGIPIDTQTWDSSLNMINGFTSLFRLIEAGVFLTTVISFFIAARSRGSREYIFTGMGAFLALLGRNLLLNADTWASPGLGILFLALGTWLICTQLHKIYLWL
ncbi:MAG: hypothetical protein LBD48_00810 [Treponema sp.]|jgi:hypothetical protein|nr:hypothetical protein [Treponema sp.]